MISLYCTVSWLSPISYSLQHQPVKDSLTCTQHTYTYTTTHIHTTTHTQHTHTHTHTHNHTQPHTHNHTQPHTHNHTHTHTHTQRPMVHGKCHLFVPQSLLLVVVHNMASFALQMYVLAYITLSVCPVCSTTPTVHAGHSHCTCWPSSLPYTDLFTPILRNFHMKHTRSFAPGPQKDSLPTIFFITPTYARFTQKVDLTSLCQTLTHVPSLLWIVVEDSTTKTSLVTNLLRRCRVTSLHFNVSSPDVLAIDQRYLGLKWVKEHCRPPNCSGVVYFGDDDNKYDLRIFDEVREGGGYKWMRRFVCRSRRSRRGEGGPVESTAVLGHPWCHQDTPGYHQTPLVSPGHPWVPSDTPGCHQDTPECHQDTPECHQDTPECHQDTPECHQDTPECLQDTPGGHQDTPECHQDTPGYHQTPLVPPGHPWVPSDTPGGHQDTPECHQDTHGRYHSVKKRASNVIMD